MAPIVHCACKPDSIPPKNRSDPMRLIFLAFAILVMLYAFVSAVGCKPSLSADERYRAQIALCVERATTRLESKACRANVDFQFRVHDGGVP